MVYEYGRLTTKGTDDGFGQFLEAKVFGFQIFSNDEIRQKRSTWKRQDKRQSQNVILY